MDWEGAGFTLLVALLIVVTALVALKAAGVIGTIQLF
jgi:hypothetical protein